MFSVRKLFKFSLLQPKYCYFNSNNNYYTKIDPRKDYYAILQVPHNASPFDIKQAFLRQQKNYNPYAKQAFQVLSNFGRREEYHKMRSQNYSNDAENKNSEDQKFYQDYASSKPKLTPEEQEMSQKFNTGVKRILYVIIGLCMFGPFFFWEGGNKSQQELAADAMYPRRYGGMAMSRPGYQDQYTQDPRMYPQNQPDVRSMNPPGYTVTGRIVED